MSTQPELALEIMDWDAAQARVMPLRMRVFVVEQGVPADIELDAFDALSRHAVGLNAGGEVIATGRLLPDGHIGRMAVDGRWRGCGIGARGAGVMSPMSVTVWPSSVMAAARPATR